MAPPPGAATPKLRGLSEVALSVSSSPTGLATVKRWVVEPPTAHSSSGSDTGTAASASSCNSYQNSPAIGLTNATEPYDTP